MAHEATFPRAIHLHQRRDRPSGTPEVLHQNWFGRRLMTVGSYVAAWLLLLTGGILLSSHAAGLF